ncbi:hypothetical protein FXO38_14756 [Capsicum annuum]|nr:hypothetical protein FXO37_23015 [Capsicum annuum]KAF3655260.1 hypothetical protein FXO38_14756 [Capsicum annuum]
MAKNSGFQLTRPRTALHKNLKLRRLYFEDIIAYLVSLFPFLSTFTLRILCHIVYVRYTRKLGKVKYEIVLGYTEASTAIVSLIYACEVIKSVSRQLGMMATFVPKLATQNDGAS